MRMEEIASIGRVIFVLNYSSVEDGVQTSTMLYKLGLRVFEITLRSPVAIDILREVRKALPDDAFVGAGTILSSDQLSAAIDAGASFGVSAGLTDRLAAAIKESALAFLPGVSNVSQAMRASEQGFTMLKFYPAEAAGGVAYLQSMASILPTISFCPTGGINQENLSQYLSLNNVACVGGSWMLKRTNDGVIDVDGTMESVKIALET